MKKYELAQHIKKFMYDYKFKNNNEDKLDTNVISSSFLNSVISVAYSDNSKVEPYSIICGDFNKLNELNAKIGFSEGDKCFRKAIFLISTVLPKEAIICRYGGDEFIFLLPNITDKKEVEKYIKDIHSILYHNRSVIHSLSISLAHGNSAEANSLSQVYSLVDKRVSEEKLSSSDDDNFYKTFETLYNALRLSPEFKFTTKQIRDLISIEIEATCQMIKKYKETGKLNDEDPNMYKDLSIIYKNEEYCKKEISISEARKINEIFIQNEEVTSQMLEKVNNESLIQIARDLIYLYAPNAFSKDYYEHYLKENLPNNKKYRAALLSLSGLKLSNLLIGHNDTDKYLHESTYKNVKRNIDEVLPLCTELFNPNGYCYKIAMGGGDILYIEPAESRYRPKNEFYQNNDQEPLLKYIKISTTHPIEKDKIMDFVHYARINCKTRKDELKKDIFRSSYAIELAKVCLKSSIRKYFADHPDDYDDINNVREFIETECREMLKFKKIKEKEQRKTSFIPTDIHFDYCYDEAKIQDEER